MNAIESGRTRALEVPHMRYIADAVAELKAADPKSPVTVYMVRRLVKAGSLPSTPIGRRCLVDVAQLYDYLAHPDRYERQPEPEQRGGIRQVAL